MKKLLSIVFLSIVLSPALLGMQQALSLHEYARKEREVTSDPDHSRKDFTPKAIAIMKARNNEQKIAMVRKVAKQEKYKKSVTASSDQELKDEDCLRVYDTAVEKFAQSPDFETTMLDCTIL